MISMTVLELIEELKTYSEDWEVNIYCHGSKDDPIDCLIKDTKRHVVSLYSREYPIDQEI